jgi:hypothetical protein
MHGGSMKRICVNVTDEQAAALKERAEVTGVLQSEIIRRAIADLCPLELEMKVRKMHADREAFVTKYGKPGAKPVLVADVLAALKAKE